MDIKTSKLNKIEAQLYYTDPIKKAKNEKS